MRFRDIEWGPVDVTTGPHEGRIGELDDERVVRRRRPIHGVSNAPEARIQANKRPVVLD